MTILLPGDYILELKTSRPMDVTTLTTVLENAGFNRLVFDSPVGSPATNSLVGRGGGGVTAIPPKHPPVGVVPRPTHPKEEFYQEPKPVLQIPITGGCDPSFLLEDDYYAPPQYQETYAPQPLAQVVFPRTPPLASPQMVTETPLAPPQMTAPQAPLAPPQVVVWRIVGRLPVAARLSDLPGLTWKSHKLRVSPNSSLNLTTTPFKVLNGQAYDLKFLSADKRHPTRKHVVAAIIAMGFKPFILAAIKKNARIPGRPNVSMTEWIAVARWMKPSDTILDDKPFHFEDLKEVHD
jgi:hypothetical protein